MRCDPGRCQFGSDSPASIVIGFPSLTEDSYVRTYVRGWPLSVCAIAAWATRVAALRLLHLTVWPPRVVGCGHIDVVLVSLRPKGQPHLLPESDKGVTTGVQHSHLLGVELGGIL
jgi:hypothetical protein